MQMAAACLPMVTFFTCSCTRQCIHVVLALCLGIPELLASIAEWRCPRHYHRNLHRLIIKFGLSLPVGIDCVTTPVKVRTQVADLPWPVLMLSSWLRLIFERTSGAMVLNGFNLEESDSWERELLSFWALFRKVQPNHPIYQKGPEVWARCIPFQYHGDEGRGKLRRSVLICSYAPALQWKGHSFLSRLLATVMPGERYACTEDGRETLEVLHAAMAADLIELFEDGLKVLVAC